MDTNLKEFVIVEFIKTSEVATVLRSWMKQNDRGGLECLWPEQSNSVRKALVSGTKPLPTWTSWEIRVLTSCDTFKEALRKEKRAQDTSDLASCVKSDAGKGCRIRKPINRLISSSESDEDDIPQPKLKKPRQSNPSNFSPFSISPPKTAGTPTRWNERLEGTLSGAEPQPSTSINCNHGGLCLKMQEQQEKVERTMQMMKMELKEVLDIVTQMARAPQSRVLSSMESDNSRTQFAKQFPIRTLDDFLQLEDSLKSEDANNLMIEFFTRIGGNSVEDSVRRTLVRLLTNEVAVHFSWEGRKGKRALNSLSIVKILERVLSATYSTTFTSKVFENRLREWFRQAGTRIWNKTKKNGVMDA